MLEALLPERLVKEVDPVWQAKMRAWGNRVLRELGVSAAFDMRNPLIRAHLEHFAATKISGLVNEHTRRELREALGAGVAAGEGIGELRKRVLDVFDQASKKRAIRIARTEVVGSSNFANVEAFAQSGVVPGKGWLSVRSESTRDTHRDLDGQVVKLREPFRAPDGASAQHPGGFGVAEQDINCFPAWTPFESPFRVDRVYRRLYRGEVVRVLVEDLGVSESTPNHPVLTDAGWKPAYLLEVGDRVVELRTQVGHTLVHDPQRRQPMLAEEVFRAAAAIAPGQRVAGRAAQFHGDGAHEDVDVVTVDWGLEVALDAALTQRLCEDALAVADASAPSDRSAAEFIFGSLHASHRGVRGLGKLLTLLRTCASHPNEHRRRATSWINASADQIATHGGTRAAEAFREFLLADAGAVEGYEPFARKLLALGALAAFGGSTEHHAGLAQPDADCLGVSADGLADLAARLSGGVQFRRVLHLERGHFEGHVFNLETAAGWYQAGSVIRKNCRCSVLPVVELEGKAHKALTEAEKVGVWKRFDARLGPWEKSAARALRRGFRAQERDVLAALERVPA